MQRYEQLRGSDRARAALEELIGLGWRMAVAYRAAGRRAPDHRVRAALDQLGRDHRRHVRELREILEAVGGEVVARDGGEPGVAWLEASGDRAAAGVVAAMRRAEAELRDAYARQVERGLPEPLRGVMTRHLREEEAHLAWLEESRWWRSAGG